METSDKSPVRVLLNQLLPVEWYEDITSLSIFRCVKCTEFLLPPIQLVQKLGNVCGKCNFDDASQTALHNEVLETLLQNLQIPCPNKSKGCKYLCDYYQVSTHLKTCPNRDYHCPFNILMNCKWKGEFDSIVGHCCEEHPEFLLEVHCNSFTVNFDTKSKNGFVKFLKLYNYNFIFHVKWDYQRSLLYYQMCYVGNIDDVKDLSVTINQLGKNGINLQYELKKIIPFTDFPTNFSEEHALKIDLTDLKQFISCSIEIIVNINEKKKLQDMHELVLTVLKCAICYNYMKTPIFQCSLGHSLCNNCKDQQSQCPQCNCDISCVRNYTLETLACKINIPCQYQELGCRTIMIGSEIIEHERDCLLKPYSCPFSEIKGCIWKGHYPNIANHLSQQHSYKTKFSNCTELPMIVSFANTSTSDMHCLIFNGDTFRVSHKVDRGNCNACWSVEYVGPKSNAKNYKCEIRLVHPTKIHHQLIQTNLCKELTNYDNIFKDCIVFPLSLMPFTGLRGLVYSCKITKISST